MDKGFVRETPVGYLQITGLNAVKSFMTQWATAYPGIDLTTSPVVLLIDAETQAVRWRDDAQDPAAGVGKRIPANAEIIYTANGLANLRFIEEAASAKLNISVYRHIA